MLQSLINLAITFLSKISLCSC